jgi:hypothetical protein
MPVLAKTVPPGENTWNLPMLPAKLSCWKLGAMQEDAHEYAVFPVF